MDMLIEGDALFTIAELSVAFAGFASLASVLARHRAEVNSERLLNMLSVSLGVTGLSLIPTLFATIGWSEETIWRASGLGGVLGLCLLAWRIGRRTSAVSRLQGYSRAGTAANIGLFAVGLLGFLCCIAGWPSASRFTPYYAALLALLGVSGTLFFRVIKSLLSRVDPSGE